VTAWTDRIRARFNEKQIGRNLIELKDIDGKLFVKERVELAHKQPTFWQEYKLPIR